MPQEFIVNQWSEFFEAVRAARADLGDPKVTWYRGHSRPQYVLIPSLLRFPEGLAKEQELFDDYDRSASHLLPKRDNDWERLFDMQHYGIPTRLLDWTEVLGISVAFALYDSRREEENAVIFVLDPLALNKSSGLKAIKQGPGDARFEYKSIYWNNDPFAANYPIAFSPRLQSDRLVSQRGTFTIHGSNLEPLDQQVPNCVRRILLTPAAKPGGREFLDHAALDPLRIYPDIVGMARHLIRKHLE